MPRPPHTFRNASRRDLRAERDLQKLGIAQKDKAAVERAWAVEVARAATIEDAFYNYIEACCGKAGASQITRAIDAWIADSWTPLSVRMQGALAALGAPGSLPRRSGLTYESENWQKGYEDPGLQRLVREVYLITQAVLKARGLRSVVLYRGLRTNDSVEMGETRSFPSRPLTSWTTSKGVAQRFSQVHQVDSGRTGVVIEARVPASSIFLAPEMIGGSGYTQQEREYILLGNRRARIVSVW